MESHTIRTPDPFMAARVPTQGVAVVSRLPIAINVAEFGARLSALAYDAALNQQ